MKVVFIKIKNNVLVIILLLILVISIFGTLMNLNLIQGVTEFRSFTGAWDGATVNTSYGALNLTISSQLRINFSMDNVSFGSGYVKPEKGVCVLSTGETEEDVDGCAEFYPPGIVHGLLLENIGNEYAQINLSNRNYSSSLFGDSDAGYAWKWDAFNEDTCFEGKFDDAFENFLNLTEDNYMGAPGYDVGKILCEKMNYALGSNKINITFKLHIPRNSRPGSLSDTWYAIASIAN